MTNGRSEEITTSAARGCDVASVRQRLEDFLAGRSPDRVFAHPINHPSEPTGLCYCEQSYVKALRLYIRAVLLGLMAHCPFDGPKTWLLRRLGAKVGANVHMSPGVWIDPMFPQLLTLEDNVFIGIDVRIFMHEYDMREFRAGRVTVREGALIGGLSVIGCGVEIGRRATLAAGAILRRDVPPGATAIGNPARIMRSQENDQGVPVLSVAHDEIGRGS